MNSEPAYSSKRIAKNTVLLYVRMGLSMAISLYTSRVILQILGVSDFGLYQVVGGIVGLFLFLNATLSGATSRFITYELGCGDFNSLARTFKMAVTIHIVIALIVVFLAETIGLWFIYNKLVVPIDRMKAVLWVYQFSICAAILAILQVPYTAVIIAYERMQVYAYTSIFDSVARLGVYYIYLHYLL